MYFKETS